VTDQPGGQDGTSNPPDADPQPGYPQLPQPPPAYALPPAQPGYPPPAPPGYAAPGYPPPGYAPPGYAPPYAAYPPAASTNTMAILALIFGIIIPPLGIVFGIIARSQVKQSGESGEGLATAGLVVGLVLTALYVLFIIWIAVVLGTVARDLPRISDIPRFTDFPTPFPTPR